MIRIIILGSGNLATHLFKAFVACPTIEVVQCYARDITKIDQYKDQAHITDDFTKLLEADIYILAVSDDAIAKISQHLRGKRGLVVHTSGSATLDVLLPNQRRGSFYPLQTFTKAFPVDFKVIPICIEAVYEEDFLLLHKLADHLSDKVVSISSNQRQGLHLAAVFVNNFTNHLYHIGNEICEANAISFDLLKPLIQETAHKILSNPPLSTQTGPAKRNDKGTIEKHKTLLQQRYHKEIYSLLSESIKNTYGQKL